MNMLRRRYNDRSAVSVRTAEDIEDRQEIVSRRIKPDALLSGQLAEHRPVRGDVRLLLAVLEEAVSTFRHNIAAKTRREQRLLLEAEEWFRSDDNGWLFAFESICNMLGFDPDLLRKGLERWKQTASPEGANRLRPVRRMRIAERTEGLRRHCNGGVRSGSRFANL